MFLSAVLPSLVIVLVGEALVNIFGINTPIHDFVNRVCHSFSAVDIFVGCFRYSFFPACVTSAMLHLFVRLKVIAIKLVCVSNYCGSINHCSEFLFLSSFYWIVVEVASFTLHKLCGWRS